MIEEHPSELRADIARYFPGRSLNEFHRLSEDGQSGSMSWLELWEFFQALPFDSMTRSALAGDHAHRRWSESDYMLREVLSLLQFQSRIAWVGHQLKDKPPDLHLWDMPDLRSPEEAEAEQELAAARAERARKFREATRPGGGDTEYARKLAAAREEHLRQVAQAARQQTGERPADN